MKEEILQQMPEHFKTLPEEVQNFVYDNAWQERVDEIAKKYTLNEKQAESLSDLTLLIIIGLEKPENFQPLLVSELGISEILAEQIIEDLDKRVFEYAIKTLEKEPPKQESDIMEKPFGKTLGGMPENLPIGDGPQTEKHHILKNQETVKEPVEIKKEAPAYKPYNPREKEGESPASPTIEKKEEAQKPFSVPRFTADPVEEDTPEKTNTPQEKPSSSPEIMMGDKFNKVTKTKTESEKKDFPKEYTVDPYREPIE